MNRQTSEALRMGAAQNASILLPVGMTEGLQLGGHFDWVMRGPLPHQRDAYIECRDEIAELERAIRQKRPAKLAGLRAPLLAKRRAQLAQFKLEEHWRDRSHNLVMTVGGNDCLNQYFAGSGYTAAFYMGLVGSTSYTTGFALADTMASHAGWVEDTSYTQGTRPAMTFSSASGKSISLSSGCTFSINATVTYKGSFVTTNSTKGGSTGTLFSGGLFSGGDQPAVNGNTLTGSYSCAV